MAYDWVFVFQGGKRDGCTELRNTVEPVAGYETAHVVAGHEKGAMHIAILRPWTTKDKAPSYL